MRDICLSCPCYLSSSNDCASLEMFQALRNDQLFLTRCHVFDSTHPRFQRAFRTECDGLGIIPNPTWVDEDHAEHRGAPVWNRSLYVLLPRVRPFFCLIFTIFPTMNSQPLRAADFEVTVLPAGGAPQCPEQGKGKHSATNDRRRV